MEVCVERVAKESGTAQAFEDMSREIKMGRRYGDEYSYICLLLQKQDSGDN